MKQTMQTAADNLNLQVAKMGEGWTWVHCEIGYVVHQGEIPFEQRGAVWWGINAFRNPILLGKHCSAAANWAPTL